MDTNQRRQKLLQLLHSSGKPLTGAALAQLLGVSRQVIVTDIAVLRAAGENIYATLQGYMIPGEIHNNTVKYQIVCVHGMGQLARELEIIIDNGGKVLDVIVDHPIYGEIKANLLLTSRRDLAQFLEQLTAKKAQPLSMVTGGVHIHTIEVPSAEVFKTITKELAQAGILQD